MEPTGYVSNRLTFTRVEPHSGTSQDAPRFADEAESVDGAGRPAASLSGDANSARTFEPPLCPCDNCRSRVAEAISLRARANLLRDAIEFHDEPAVVRHHAVQLLEMLWARGVC